MSLLRSVNWLLLIPSLAIILMAMILGGLIGPLVYDGLMNTECEFTPEDAHRMEDFHTRESRACWEQVAGTSIALLICQEMIE